MGVVAKEVKAMSQGDMLAFEEAGEVAIAGHCLKLSDIKCPMEPLGSVLCGYYVCQYMLELIKGRYINITPNFMLNAPKTYTVEQIDEVRNIWAEFTLNFKPKSNGG